MLAFTALSTPRHDGQTLVEPGAEKLAALVVDNRRRLRESDCEIHGRSLAELRGAVRSALVGQSGDTPVVVTGHQPEFYHAGVWAKNFVASRLAAAVGGRGVNLIVDNDAPKKTTLTVPHRRDGVLATRELSFTDYRVGWAFEQYDALDAEAGSRFVQEIRAALGDEAYDASSMGLIAPALTGDSGSHDLVDQVTDARKAVEAGFGIDLIERRVSQCWAGPLLLDILLNAPRFAECYNAALADYRGALGISGTNRPVPDLVEQAGRIELPVWVYRHGRERRRLFVERAGDKVTFHAETTPMGSLGIDDLKQEDGLARLAAVIGWRFRPRALTLTLWARLLLADLFIHGIGGAKYDRITDRLIQRYLGIEPPAMACVSATLLIPLERFAADRAALLSARRKVRDVRYNPHRYLSAITGDLSELLQRRIDAIAESDRLRSEDRLNRPARRRAFETIRRANADLLTIDPGLADRLSAQADRIEGQLAHNRVADSREYFFGLLPKPKLDQLADALPSVEQLRGPG